MNWDQQGEPGGQLALFPALDPMEEKVISIISPLVRTSTSYCTTGLPPGKVSSLLWIWSSRTGQGTAWQPLRTGREAAGRIIFCVINPGNTVRLCFPSHDSG
jgi:hypothetical protein